MVQLDDWTLPFKNVLFLGEVAHVIVVQLAVDIGVGGFRKVSLKIKYLEYIPCLKGSVQV